MRTVAQAERYDRTNAASQLPNLEAAGPVANSEKALTICAASALVAVRAACEAVRGLDHRRNEMVVDAAFKAASAAESAVRAGVAGAPVAAPSAIQAVHAAERADYERLLDAAMRDHWTDDRAVPPEFFGQLWPYGAPKGWTIAGRKRSGQGANDRPLDGAAASIGSEAARRNVQRTAPVVTREDRHRRIPPSGAGIGSDA